MVPRMLIIVVVALLTTACSDNADSGSPSRQRVAKFNGPELIPQELVAALLTGYVAPGPKTPEIVVGRLPEDVPFEVPRPAHARVVGAVSRPEFGTAVFSVPERPLEAVKAYRELLRTNGWDDPGGEFGSGFQPPDMVHSGTFCRGDHRSINAAAVERSDRETFLKVQYFAGGRRHACDERRAQSMRPERGPMPTFYPPPDVRIVDATGGGGLNYTEASARLQTELKPAELVTRYGTQLRAEGWTTKSDPSGSEIVAQSWSFEDRQGKPWIGVLVAMAIPDSDQREVLFRVVPREVTRRRD